ncbi:hypothetical protein ACQP2T_07500 [Nonomuraea sp. CA-143628]|uniref:hypothetical protein n=1 Tax=Nonomuraea sp. CA-143628 TaxID=3239997 RepID=UPI003D92590D
MTHWFRSHWADEDTWFYIEADDEGWVTRQIEFRGPDEQPFAAASLAEWQTAFESGEVARYGAVYDRIAEQPVHEWEGHDPEPLTLDAFDQAWARAHDSLSGPDYGTGSLRVRDFGT